MPIALPAHLLAEPTSRLVAVAAPVTLAQPLILESIALWLARGRRLGLVIGHNQLDLRLLARRVKLLGADPRAALARIEISRAETCHQLYRRIQTIDTTYRERWFALYILGMLDTFYDESIKYREAAWLLQSSLAHLKTLTAAGLPVLIAFSAPREPGREALMQYTARAVDFCWSPSSDTPALPPPPQLSLPMPQP